MSVNQHEKHLKELEAHSVYTLRESYANFKNLAMLWSIGKDSTVLLWLTRKAFFGHVPFPLIHVDTNFKIPAMIQYRDQLVKKWNLQMLVGQNLKALESKQTFPDGSISRLDCCKLLKTKALVDTISGKGDTVVFDHEQGKYVPDHSGIEYRGVIVGARGDEEGSRSKERVFSPRGQHSQWDIGQQPPEFWGQFNTDFPKGTHVRIHPILDWSELDIWRYIQLENIPIVDLYFDRGEGRRYRSLGCYPCTNPVESTATDVDSVVRELESGKLANIAERSGRAQDADDGGGLETLRRDGYM